MGSQDCKGGAHSHVLVRDKLRTALSGAHVHLFLIDGTLVSTITDGAHRHPFSRDDAATTDMDDGHVHLIEVPGGEVVSTVPGGVHAHGLLVDRTLTDGFHVHQLQLVEGEHALVSLTPGQFWALLNISLHEEVPDVEKGLSKPFRSPGGKRGQLDELLKMLPEHTVYVEPYAGGASVFWAKEPSDTEVLSDIDPEIIKTYQFLQGASDKDFEWMRAQEWKPGKATFERLKSSKPSSAREVAYRFKYLNLYSARGRGGSFDAQRLPGGTAPSTGSVFLKNLEKYRERLKGVKLFCEDALSVIKRFDKGGALLYIDPPWVDEGRGREAWKGYDEAAFVKAVSGITKAKALMSYQGYEQGDVFAELAKREAWSSRNIKSADTGYLKGHRQLLMWNYSTSTKKAASSSSNIVKSLDALRAFTQSR